MRSSDSQVSEQKSSDDIPAVEASIQPTDTVENVAESSTPTPNLAEQANLELSCDLCDFKSKWKNGVKIHKTRIHRNMEQLDGSNDLKEEEEDFKYLATCRYWEEGEIGTGFQTYLDAVDIIGESDIR